MIRQTPTNTGYLWFLTQQSRSPFRLKQCHFGFCIFLGTLCRSWYLSCSYLLPVFGCPRHFYFICSHELYIIRVQFGQTTARWKQHRNIHTWSEDKDGFLKPFPQAHSNWANTLGATRVDLSEIRHRCNEVFGPIYHDHASSIHWCWKLHSKHVYHKCVGWSSTKQIFQFGRSAEIQEASSHHIRSLFSKYYDTIFVFWVEVKTCPPSLTKIDLDVKEGQPLSEMREGISRHLKSQLLCIIRHHRKVLLRNHSR